MYLDTSSNSAAQLNLMLMNIVDECFPEVWTSIKSTDSPWMDRRIKRKIRQRKRVYYKEGRSARWHRLKRETEEMIRKGKKKFFEKMKKEQ